MLNQVPSPSPKLMECVEDALNHDLERPWCVHRLVEEVIRPAGSATRTISWKSSNKRAWPYVGEGRAQFELVSALAIGAHCEDALFWSARAHQRELADFGPEYEAPWVLERLVSHFQCRGLWTRGPSFPRRRYPDTGARDPFASTTHDADPGGRGAPHRGLPACRDTEGAAPTLLARRWGVKVPRPAPAGPTVKGPVQLRRRVDEGQMGERLRKIPARLALAINLLCEEAQRPRAIEDRLQRSLRELEVAPVDVVIGAPERTWEKERFASR